MAEPLELPLRGLFLAGYAHVALAALAGLARAARLVAYPEEVPLLLASAGLVLVALAVAYGFAPPFVKREVLGVWPAYVAMAAVGVGTALAVALPLARLDPTPLVAGAYGVAFLVPPIHLAASALAGAPWRGGIALFAKDQPFRRGDALAAAAFAASFVALAASGALLLGRPHGVVTAGLVALLLGHLATFFGGVLVFLLPRNAKTPLPGLTLVAFALLVHVAAVVALVLAFVFPLDADFRYPAAGALLATLLFGVALLRLRVEKPGPVLARARPWLGGAAALGVLAPLALVLALAGGEPGPLLPVAAIAYTLLAAVLAVAATLLCAPILLNSVPREGRWGAWAAALAIAGLFLLAPSYQYERAAFPGAVLLAAACALAVWGLAPMRTPRR
jgi:hypothetical protein